jgi:hypothetical protein
MTERPRCAYCDKPAPKMTTTVYIRKSGDDRQKDGRWYRYIYPATPLRSIEQCRAYTNQRVISVAYSVDSTVAHFAEWDGETYWLKYGGAFCTTQCAVKFARAAHKAGYRMVKAAVD